MYKKWFLNKCMFFRGFYFVLLNDFIKLYLWEFYIFVLVRIISILVLYFILLNLKYIG